MVVRFVTRAFAHVLALLVVTLVSGGASAVLAQASPASAAANPDMQRQYRSAFDAMLADPGNLDKTFKFAQLAIQVNDLEGAVGALERMLIINPNLPRVRLELGVLYYRLGSFEAARTYLQSALASPDLPPEVRTRADAVLAEIDKQRNPSRFTGSFLAGMRYQTDANAAPGTGVVRVGGIDSQLGPSGTAIKDWNVFAVGALTHLYDLGTQDGDIIDSRLILYGSRQFKAEEVNLFFTSLSSGPRMHFLPDLISNTVIRPAAYLDYVRLADRTEYVAPGAGVNIEHAIDGGLLTLALDYRRRFYHNSSEKPFNTNRDGNDLGVRFSVDEAITPWLAANAGVGLAGLGARRSFESYLEWSVWGGVTFLLEELSFVQGQRGALAFTVARVGANYREADPTIDPDVTRRDRDWRLSATVSVPLVDAWALVVQGGVTDRKSSLPNYEYRNWYGGAGIAWHF